MTRLDGYGSTTLYVYAHITDIGQMRATDVAPSSLKGGYPTHHNSGKLLYGDGCIKHSHCETCPFKDCKADTTEMLGLTNKR